MKIRSITNRYDQHYLKSVFAFSVSIIPNKTNAVITTNENKTRVRYKTNTASGSSGAPCFSANWELVALHHFGDPNDQPQYNQGIPFTAISRLLEASGHKDIFSNSISSDASASQEYEVSKNTKSVPHPQPQGPFLPEKLPGSTSLESGASMSSSVNQEPAHNEGPIDSPEKTPPDEGKPSKIIDISRIRDQHAIWPIPSNRSPLQQARQYFDNARKFADDAYAPFAEGNCPPREKFIDAIASLIKAKQSLSSLRTLLSNNSSIPEILRAKRTRINNYINTIVEQIDKFLVPSLSRNQAADFSSLQRALRKIDELIPRQNSIQK